MTPPAFATSTGKWWAGTYGDGEDVLWRHGTRPERGWCLNGRADHLGLPDPRRCRT